MQYNIKKIQQPHINSSDRKFIKFTKLTIKVIGNEKFKQVLILALKLHYNIILPSFLQDNIIKTLKKVH